MLPQYLKIQNSIKQLKEHTLELKQIEMCRVNGFLNVLGGDLDLVLCPYQIEFEYKVVAWSNIMISYIWGIG